MLWQRGWKDGHDFEDGRRGKEDSRWSGDEEGENPGFPFAPPPVGEPRLGLPARVFLLLFVLPQRSAVLSTL